MLEADLAAVADMTEDHLARSGEGGPPIICDTTLLLALQNS